MKLTAIAISFALLSAPAFAQDRTPAPEGARAYIISPKDGATVSSPVTVIFGLEGMGVAPAGTEKEKTGHHHLIIDVDLPSLNEPVPSDENHRHFGGGQTQVNVELTSGSHTLQLIMGDHNHIPHDPPVASEKISIIVK
ncbi:MAG: DUF4399 domain-containing protein [Rhizobiaceae bacterium]